MKKLLVNQILPFANVDGDGNRCSIFLQECNIECVYCHNSETINLCNHCGLCVPGCPSGALTVENDSVVFNEVLCIKCDQCIITCPFKSTPKAKWMSISDILEEIKKVKSYIRGITVSGGEPTIQSDALVTLFKEVKELGLTCYVDTNGSFNIEEMSELIEVTDKFLFDVKAIGDQIPLCGVALPNIMNNLNYLLEHQKIAEVRTVILESLMDIDGTVDEVIKLLRNYKEVPYRLIKAHTVGLRADQKKIVESYIVKDEHYMRLQDKIFKLYSKQ